MASSNFAGCPLGKSQVTAFDVDIFRFLSGWYSTCDHHVDRYFDFATAAL